MNKILVILSTFFLSSVALAEEVGKVTAKGGWFSKDSIGIKAFDDPGMGVTCYTTYYDRAWSMSDSSSTSISCRKTGAATSKFSTKSNVFAQSKGWLKTTVVDRFYDAQRKVLVYLTYTKGAGKSASHSISVVVVR